MAATLVGTSAADVDTATPVADLTSTVQSPTSTPLLVAEAPDEHLATLAPTPFGIPPMTIVSPTGSPPTGVGAPSRPSGATPAPTPVPTAASKPKPKPKPSPPPPPPPPPPPVNVGGNRCGSIPGEPAGWARRVQSTFSENTPLGAWPGPVAAKDWRSRTAGYKDSSGRGTYDSGKTITEHDGLLDAFIHSEGNTRYIAAPIPLIGDTTGQRINICMRADPLPGYKLAFLLWPRDGSGNSRGEIDYPEGKLTLDGAGNAFMHYDPKPAGNPNQDAYSTGRNYVDWHLYTLEWNPGSPSSQADDYAAFYVDGVLIGRSTGARVPDGPMHYIMQIETYVSGQALPAPAAGHVILDWVTISTPG